MAFQERYYQSEAVEAFQKHLMEKDTHPLVVLPTGSGKTAVMSRIIGDEIKADPTSRIGVISHQKELLEQGYRTLYNHMPSASLGIHSAGLGKSSTDAQIMFMGIQSVHRKSDILGNFDIFLVDECFSGDTELLTDKGYVRFDEIKKDHLVAQFDEDTHKITFTNPIRIINKKPSSDVYRMHSHKMGDWFITAGHRMLIHRDYGIAKTLHVPMKDVSLNQFTKFITAGSGVGDDVLTNWEKMVLAFQADGNLHNQNIDGTQILYFSFSKQRKIDEFIKLARSFNYRFSEVSCGKGSSENVKQRRRFSITVPGGMTKDLFSHFDLKDMSAKKARQIVEYSNKWDGHVASKSTWLITCTDKRNIDFLQAVCALGGMQARICEVYDKRTDVNGKEYGFVYRLFIRHDSDKIGTQSIKKEVTEFSDNVYCVEVPDGNVIVRKNGNQLVVGNCHLIPRNADTMYGRFIAEMHDKVPHLRVGGFTATPYRTDSGRLDDGEGAIFDEVCYEIGTGTLINQGYLCPLITKNTETKLNITGVGKAGGEFKPKQLQEAVDEYETSKAACEEIVAYGRQQMRRSWVVFASGVNHAHNVTEILQDMGVNAVCLTGETQDSARDDYLRRFKNYQLECIVNVGILSTGFDHPGVDLIAMLNPTASTGRYVQICGRGLRVIYPKGFNPETCSHDERAQAIMGSIKPNCTVLDFAGNILRHGPIDDLNIRPKGVRENSEDAIAPTKICMNEGCETIVSVSTRTCPDCGYEWEINEKPKHDTVASDAAIMKSAHNIPTVLWTQVKSIQYEIWRKPGQKESLRISYETLGYGDVTEWIAVETIGTRRRIAEKWWGQVSGKERETCPKTTKEVFDMLPELVDITTVAVEKNGKYWNAIARRADSETYVAAYKMCQTCGVLLPKSDQCSCNETVKENENWLSLK